MGCGGWEPGLTSLWAACWVPGWLGGLSWASRACKKLRVCGKMVGAGLGVVAVVAVVVGEDKPLLWELT